MYYFCSMISMKELKNNLNKAAAQGIPFLFGVDYECKEGFFIPHALQQKELLWRVGAYSNITNVDLQYVPGSYFEAHPLSEEEYDRRFQIIRQALHRGDTFLANLTVQTPLHTDYSMEELLWRSNAPYTLFWPHRFVCFSPETFVRITSEGRISTYPMKGTIEANVPNAEQVILSDYKETAEHCTIVDFLRSELARVGEGVQVDRFRYIDCLKTSRGEVLQVSSEISAGLFPDWRARLGDVLFELLPAGSISGAPKEATVSAIATAEQGEKRGFYSGVFGYYDGSSLETAVMIRYIEQVGEQLFYRSGGGITINSSMEAEYKEVIEKVYLPFLLDDALH